MVRVIGVFIALAAIAVMGGLLFLWIKAGGGGLERRHARRQLLATGLPATGRVLGVGGVRTSLRVDGRRHLDVGFHLEVTLPGRAPYIVQTTQLIDPDRMPHVQPGAQLHLRVDATDPTLLVVTDGAAAGPQRAPGQWPGGYGGPRG